MPKKQQKTSKNAAVVKDVKIINKPEKPKEILLPSSSRRFRSWLLLASFLALGTLLARSNRVPSSGDYAVCSTAGKIYTVDTSHPNVQCIVVRETLIADVGDLGMFSYFEYIRESS